jgi:hypothetical protein
MLMADVLKDILKSSFKDAKTGLVCPSRFQTPGGNIKEHIFEIVPAVKLLLLLVLILCPISPDDKTDGLYRGVMGAFKLNIVLLVPMFMVPFDPSIILIIRPFVAPETNDKEVVIGLISVVLIPALKFSRAVAVSIVFFLKYLELASASVIPDGWDTKKLLLKFIPLK